MKEVAQKWFFFLEDNSTLRLLLFLDNSFVELEDNGHSQEDTRTRSNCSHKVGHDTERTNTHATKGRRGGDVTVQDVNESRITVSLHYHLLITKLLGNVTSRSTRYFDPCLTEQGAGSQDKHQVENGMEGIVNDLGNTLGRGDIVTDLTKRLREHVRFWK